MTTKNSKSLDEKIDERHEVYYVNKIFGNNLSYYRKKRGFTQAKLAELSGVSRPNISSYENYTNNGRPPNTKSIVLISRALSVMPWQMFQPNKINKMNANYEYIITINNSYDSVFKKRFSSVEYFIPETYVDQNNVFPQWGKIESVPKNNPLGVSKGDVVFFHHAVRERHLGGDKYYAASDLIYGMIENKKITMFNDRVMVDPIKIEKKSINDVLLEFEKTNNRRYKVKAAPENSPLEPGMEIGAFPDSYATLRVYDQVYMILRINESVPLRYKDNGKTPVMLNGWIAIDPLDEKSKYYKKDGFHIPPKRTKYRGLGEVIATGPSCLSNSEFKVGDIVAYLKRGYFAFDLQGKKAILTNHELYNTIYGVSELPTHARGDGMGFKG